MYMIKIVVALLTVLIGTYLTRKELKSMLDILFEKEYVEWRDFERKLEGNRRLAKIPL